jgi:hypothetical protein
MYSPLPSQPAINNQPGAALRLNDEEHSGPADSI